MRCWIYMIHIYFNPRSREGSDRAEELAYYEQRIFQSALPRGERLTLHSHIVQFLLFQSALPRGERLGELGLFIVMLIFQSALPRGERHPGTDRVRFRAPISIRAPARGATIMAAKNLYLCGISIRAPARGATISARGGWLPSIFQSALPRGERPVPCHFNVFFGYFNPRSREGSDCSCAQAS